MKIAISSQGETLNSQVDPRFGRAKCFIIYDTDTGNFAVVSNDQNLNAAQGAGIQAAQNVVRQQVDLVVSGNLGPKAYATLSAAGVKTALWAEGTVADAVKLVVENKLEITNGANVQGHWM
ncbi:MAG: NifB/NifX family molybdenum-iron cluster-binding protein [candidate division Zixibacteria bacterium]|nr:NifB/NifX family molybdenum-iron cluster-binding protein [candidate division Zixibacteria bacterium]